MASRPRRSAATKANEVISVQAKWADASDKSDRSEPAAMSSRRSGRTSGGGDSHVTLTVKGPSASSRQATRGSSRRGEQFEGGEIVHGKRNRGAKKSYVVDSSPDDDEDEEDEAEIDDDEDDDMDDVGDEDAEGEDEITVDVKGVEALDAEGDEDAEGEEDAEGDIDMDTPRSAVAPTIKVSRPTTSRSAARAAASKIVPDDEEDEEDDDDDDDELSDPGDSDAEGDMTMGFGDDTMADQDAEGEEIEVAGDEDDEAEAAEADSEDGSGAESPDLDKMTKRQRARFDEGPQEYMKLSDEVQAKKVFTAEELSMRRQEMARRRRNLSDKRNEEVKMETINKLLKKQAPKISRKAAAAARGSPDDESNKTNSVFIRWVNNKNGTQVAVPEDIMAGPAGKVFSGAKGAPAGKTVEEVA